MFLSGRASLRARKRHNSLVWLFTPAYSLLPFLHSIMTEQVDTLGILEKGGGQTEGTEPALRELTF